jgi:glucose-1-phosphate thymidylyltransferase
MQVTKGIILAGGTGSRLYPLTVATNKHLLPLYSKPVIYYSLSTLMLAGIRDVLIISSKDSLPHIERLLGTGEKFGIKCSYCVQKEPNGLPEAFILAEEFLNNRPSMLILGDNFFYGNTLGNLLQSGINTANGAHLFLHPVQNPSAYGVATLDDKQSIQTVIEKPKNYASDLAITGLYLFDQTAPCYAKTLKPSDRGEIEITDLIKIYLRENRVSYSTLGRGYTWYDTGTPASMLQVSNFVETIETRQGLLVSSPEEIALRLGYISKKQFHYLIEKMPDCLYKNFLKQL